MNKKIFNIKFYFRGGKNEIPFDYQEKLISFLHREILGNNNKYHDDVSLYSFSQLYNNTKTTSNGLLFEKGAIWIIRTADKEIFKDFYLKAKNAINKELSWDLILKNVEYNIEDFVNINKVNVGVSPIYLGQNKNFKERHHITFKDDKEIVSESFKKTFLTKAKKMGYDFKEEDFDIEFDMKNPIKTAVRHINKNINITTRGRININAKNSDIINLIYAFGVGKSTGCGFGFLFNFKHNK